MFTVAFTASVLLYAIACMLYLGSLYSSNPRRERFAAVVFATGLGCQILTMVLRRLIWDGAVTWDIYGTLSLASGLLALFFLVSAYVYHVHALGAFVAPITLMLFVASTLGQPAHEVSHAVRSALLPVHVLVNVLGIGACGVAAAASIAYLVQEHLLREKKLNGLFERLPPLDSLDALSVRSTMVGFPLLTLGLITGALWITRRTEHAFRLTASQLLAVLGWILFGTVLLLRVRRGWGGRRYAWGTVLGFACALLVLAGYLMRSVLGQAP